MILIHSRNNTKAAREIQKYCLINSLVPKIQVSHLTGNVMYFFVDDYPRGVVGVEYEDS